MITIISDHIYIRNVHLCALWILCEIQDNYHSVIYTYIPYNPWVGSSQDEHDLKKDVQKN